MAVTLFGISNCDTIKKTRKWLQEHGIDYEFHDYKKQGCSADLAREFSGQFELDDLINRRGTTWRKLSESERESLDQGKAIALMQAQPSIIKRPLLKSGSEWMLGYDADRLQQFFT